MMTLILSWLYWLDHMHASMDARTRENKQCVLQVRLPTGTVIQVQRGWQNYMNTAIYLSVADYGQTEGRNMNVRKFEG